MRQQNLPYYTPALLRDLLAYGSFTSEAFRVIRTDLPNILRRQLTDYLECDLNAKTVGPFRDFEWDSHPLVSEARQLAVSEQASTITERHVLLAI